LPLSWMGAFFSSSFAMMLVRGCVTGYRAGVGLGGGGSED
jgi:hypothetical protein